MKNIKEPVRLREKKLKNGDISLYLDIYYNGIRKYEFLKMYLTSGTSKADKERNKTTLAIANSIKAKRIIELQSGAYDITIAKTDAVLFTDYFDKVRSMKESRANSRAWGTVRKTIVEYASTNLQIKNINNEFVAGFRQYIGSLQLAEGTRHTYFRIFICVVNQAIKDGFLQLNTAANVAGFKQSEAKRIYLTADEVKMMANAKCNNEIIKRSFLFSCLTGLRLSDVIQLTWGDVAEENGYTRIIFRQKKTHMQEYLDINRQAADLMGERKNDAESVFNLTYAHQYINRAIKAWAVRAGITKNISFHTARHTFATMMLASGVDLYTVSKLVGHRDIQTTQIYAKVMDKDKQKAVDMMPEIL